MLKKHQKAASKKIHILHLRRVHNLRLLKRQFETWAGLARHCGYSKSFLCQLAGPTPVRTISEDVAFRIEAALDLPSGWLSATYRTAAS